MTYMDIDPPITWAEAETRLALTIDEAAVLLNVDYSSVRSLMQRKALPATRIGKRWCIPTKEFLEVVRS